MELFAKLRLKLTAMAFSRSKCQDKITDLSDPILEHLIKVLTFDDPTNSHKHRDDINSWLVAVWEVKPSGFKLKEKDYYTWLFEEKKAVQNLEVFSKYVRGKLKSYEALPRLRSDQEVLEMLPALYKAIAVELSKGEIPDVQSRLNN